MVLTYSKTPEFNHTSTGTFTRTNTPESQEMLPIPRTLPPTHVHQTNNTLYHKETYRIQSGQRYVSTGQPLSSGNLLTYTQNNPSYHSETKHTHFPTTNPPSPYTNRRVGLNIYTYLPPTAALQHTTNTHNNTTRANHSTHYSTPPPQITHESNPRGGGQHPKPNPQHFSTYNNITLPLLHIQ